MKLVYLYNQLGAGPVSISKILVRQLSCNQDYLFIVNDKISEKTKGNIFVVRAPKNFGKRIVLRFFVEWIFVPFTLIRYRICEIICFGNFNLIPFWGNRRVLVHHPYLVNDDELYQLNYRGVIIELVKRITFRIHNRIFPATTHIFQTQQFMDEAIHRYGIRQSQLLPNPVSDVFESFPSAAIENFNVVRAAELANGVIRIVYISRYYPHKYHCFFNELLVALRQKGFVPLLQITIDESLVDGDPDMIALLKRSDVENLGEIPQARLAAVYKRASICVFPSKIETYGNGLLEAAIFGLPVLTLARPFARDVLQKAYMPFRDAEEASNLIGQLCSDRSFYSERSTAAYRVGSIALRPAEWAKRMIGTD